MPKAHSWNSSDLKAVQNMNNASGLCVQCILKEDWLERPLVTNQETKRVHSLRPAWKLPEGLCKWDQVFQRDPGSFHISLGEGTVFNITGRQVLPSRCHPRNMYMPLRLTSCTPLLQFAREPQNPSFNLQNMLLASCAPRCYHLKTGRCPEFECSYVPKKETNSR